MSMAPRILPSSMWSRGSKSNSTGVPTRLEQREVVLAAGRRLVGRQVGDRQHRRLPLLLGRGLGGLGLLDLGGQRLGLGEQRLLLLALRLRDQLAELLLLGRAWPRTPRSPPGGRCRRPAPGPRPRRTARAWPGRRGRGRGRLGGCAGRSCSRLSASSERQRVTSSGEVMPTGYPGAPRSGAREISSAGDGILRGVLDRPRAIVLSWAALCFVLFALLGVGGRHRLGLARLARRPRPERRRSGRSTSTGCTPRCAWSRSPSARSR